MKQSLFSFIFIAVITLFALLTALAISLHSSPNYLSSTNPTYSRLINVFSLSLSLPPSLVICSLDLLFFPIVSSFFCNTSAKKQFFSGTKGSVVIMCEEEAVVKDRTDAMEPCSRSFFLFSICVAPRNICCHMSY